MSSLAIKCGVESNDSIQTVVGKVKDYVQRTIPNETVAHQADQALLIYQGIVVTDSMCHLAEVAQAFANYYGEGAQEALDRQLERWKNNA